MGDKSLRKNEDLIKFSAKQNNFLTNEGITKPITQPGTD